MKKILFIIPYPIGVAPSQRFRVEMFYPILDQRGILYESSSFLEQKDWEILYKSSKKSQKIIAVIKGFFKRIKILFKVKNFDYIFIHREATPLGPPFFEWVVAKILRKKIIYDFDDAIWLSNTSAENKIISTLKWHSKVASICKWSYKVNCGNSFLANYAEQYNRDVIIIPTVVDTVDQHNQMKIHATKKRPIIGWTGSHSTLPYIDVIMPVLKKLEKHYEFEFRVIANKNPDLSLKHFSFIPWNKETEIEDLLELDIGVMPLIEDKWSNGKCGFKAIQYMALGIPPVVSHIGVNAEITDDQINGYVVSSANEWYVALSGLLSNVEQRIIFGENAKKKIVEKYSTEAVKEVYLNLFMKSF